MRDEFVLAEDGKFTKYYRRRGDKMSIGDATLTELVYGFYKDQFSAVQAIAHAKDQRYLRDALVSQFGPGEQPNRYIDRWFWHGAAARVALDCSQRRECRLLMWSLNIDALRRAEEQNRARDAKRDF
jgi:hypothetical protein